MKKLSGPYPDSFFILTIQHSDKKRRPIVEICWNFCCLLDVKRRYNLIRARNSFFPLNISILDTTFFGLEGFINHHSKNNAFQKIKGVDCMKIKAGSWAMLSKQDKMFILKAISDRSRMKYAS